MNLLTLEDEKFKKIKVQDRYVFKVKYISPLDRIAITQRRVRLQNGANIESFTAEEYNFFESIAIIDVCTVEYPDEFKENLSCVNWPDIEVIIELSEKIRQHTEDILSKLKKNKPVEGSSE